MKKIYTVFICLLAVSMLMFVLASCEKDKDDKEIEYEKEEVTEAAEYNDDDPDNGFSDLFKPDGK